MNIQLCKGTRILGRPTFPILIQNDSVYHPKLGHHVWSESPANFQIWTVWKPDIFHPRHQTFNTLKDRNQNQKIFQILFQFFFSRFFSRFFSLFSNTSQAHGFYHMRIDNLYLLCNMLKNISHDSVPSGRTCLANLGSDPVWSGNSYTQSS